MGRLEGVELSARACSEAMWCAAKSRVGGGQCSANCRSRLRQAVMAGVLQTMQSRRQRGGSAEIGGGSVPCVRCNLKRRGRGQAVETLRCGGARLRLPKTVLRVFTRNEEGANGGDCCDDSGG